MAWRSGSMSRTLRNAVRSPAICPSPAFRRPHSTFSPNSSRRFSFTNPTRTFGELGAIQSMLPLHSVVVADARLTSHIVNDLRACCELSQGTFCRTCQAR